MSDIVIKVENLGKIIEKGTSINNPGPIASVLNMVK
jgi:hypothetical protein